MSDFEELLLLDVPLVVIDTETTGLHPWSGNRVIELAAIRLEKGQEVGRFNSLLNPNRLIEPKASQISGILNSDLIGQPSFVEVADQFLALLDGAFLVAHNATFDADFIGTELRLAGKYDRTRPNDPILSMPWLCTLRLAQRYFRFGRNNLANIAHSLGARVGQAHRALNDVYMTAEVIQRMAHQLSRQNLQKVGDLLHAQGGAIYTPLVPQIDFSHPIISEALETKQLIQIVYEQEGGSRRTVTPRYATSYHGKTYLIAWCHHQQDQQSFRADHILSAEPI